VVFKNNGQLASRLDVTSAAHMVAIAVHFQSFGLDGGATLRTLVGRSIKVIEKLPQLAVHVTSLTSKRDLLALVKSVKGDANSKRDRVATSL